MRKHKVVTIEAGRDAGKSFLVVEKSAWDTEKWATRAVLALGRADIDVPEELLGAGSIALLAIGLESFKRLPYAEAAPLLDEMQSCWSFVPDPTKIDHATGRPLSRPIMMPGPASDGDIEDVGTLIALRGEVLELHLGFSVAAVLSTLAQAATISTPSRTKTSRRRAARSSPPAAPA